MGWKDRVRFAPDGAFAYRPDRVLVKLGPAPGRGEPRVPVHRLRWLGALLASRLVAADGADPQAEADRVATEVNAGLGLEVPAGALLRVAALGSSSSRTRLLELLRPVLEEGTGFQGDQLTGLLEQLREHLDAEVDEEAPNPGAPEAPEEQWVGHAVPIGFGWFKVRLPRRVSPLEAVQTLRRLGLPASVDHVLFATSTCCGPHPAWWSHPALNPAFSNPAFSNPAFSNPAFSNPAFSNPAFSNPAFSNPAFSNPAFSNPAFSNTNFNPGRGAPWMAHGERQSSARPADQPDDWAAQPDPPRDGQPWVLVLDTGLASALPIQLASIDTAASDEDEPDVIPEGAVDELLDPVAGHGTFIAGIIAKLAPTCRVSVRDVTKPEGDVTVSDVTKLLDGMVETGGPFPEVINMSFGGYADDDMPALGDAIDVIARKSVIVASAGNDATCQPLYPAAFDGVIAVGALEAVPCPSDDCRCEPCDREHGEYLAPALFTNYGPWVDCSALGVDVVSTFFTNFDGDEEKAAVWQQDPDNFSGWARWSGTSFAAPRVAALIADGLADGLEPRTAVEQVIARQNQRAFPMLGTVVELPDD